MNNHKNISLKIFLTLLFFSSIFCSLVPGSVLAATSSIREDAFSQLNSAAGTGGADFGAYKDPRETAAKIIKIALELVGTIFIALAVYAGFLWMTAGGGEENIAKATGILRMAVIGLIIILTAYALTVFVFESLLRSTSDNNNVTDICPENNPADPNCAL